MTLSLRLGGAQGLPTAAWRLGHEAMSLAHPGHGLLASLSWPPQGGGPARALVVLCHGVGADARQMIELATAWAPAMPDVAFIAPDAPFIHHSGRWRWWPFAPPSGREWFSLIDRAPTALEAGARMAARTLDTFIDAELSWLGLTPDALVLAGFSQGAMTALFAGPRRPAAPRGIIGFSGRIPGLARLPAEIRNRAPVLLVHGEADDVVPVARAWEAEPALRALDVPVELLSLPGVGHTIDQAGIRAGAAFLRRVLA